MRTDGLALVIVQSEGSLVNERVPHLDATNEIVISALENSTKNTSSKSALSMIEKVMELCHQATWGERARQHQYVAGNPAYEIGPLTGGLIVYMANLQIKTIN